MTTCAPPARATSRRLGSRARRARAATWACAALGALLALSGVADAQAVVLHEFVAEDPKEDITFSATTLDGDLPAAIQTPSGVATAPDPRRPPKNDHVYATSASDDSVDSTYEPDRDTRRPEVERYDDPFSPATAPFKRLHAYDAVDADYSLRVGHTELRTLGVGGALASGDEAFYGDLTVDLSPGAKVRVPTVGPGARVLRMSTNPEVGVELLADGADNWFVRGKEKKRVHLVLQLAIQRATFGSEFRSEVDWPELARFVQVPPASQRAAFEEVAKAIGVSRQDRPAQAVKKLVEYFRAFGPSEVAPKGRGDIYLDLALSKKGVCRHRSFAFLVTALHLGLPTRMVTNEAHAWVEVFDGQLWHRVDLGGAANELDDDSEPGRPPYVPPPDPYTWPDQRDSGQDLVDRARRDQASNGNGGPNGNGSNGNGGNAGGAGPASTVPTSTPSSHDGPGSEVTLETIDRDVRRGLPLRLVGSVKAGGSSCANVRVDITLKSDLLPQGAAVGSLSTNDQGRFDGSVVVPSDFGVGEYEIVVSTPGDARCGPSGK
jgi:hypothetical protein